MARVGDWFDVGWDAYRDDEHRPELLPPQSDMEAQRAWLAGFGAAWASGSEDIESVDEALVRVCEGRAELLRQLRSHRLGWCCPSGYSARSSQNNSERLYRIPPPLLLRLTSRDHDYRRSDFVAAAIDEKRPSTLPSPGAAISSVLPLSARTSAAGSDAEQTEKDASMILHGFRKADTRRPPPAYS